MKVTYLGHSCFMVDAGGKSLLFDPFILPNELAKSIDISKLKPEYILLSHGHYDHVADCVEIAKNSGAEVMANFEICNWLNKQGISKTLPFNIGGTRRFDWGNIKMTTALHSSTLPDGSNGGVPGGFIVETADKSFYYAGDTALTMDFQMIGDWYELDFAVLPVGDVFTMGYEDALICSEFVDVSKVLGVHYNTFPAIMIDQDAATNHFKEAEKELVLMKVGEEREF